MDNKEIDTEEEWRRCAVSPVYFIHNYCSLFSAEYQDWIPFRLWPFQAQIIKALSEHVYVVNLKCRQIGFTWVAKAFDLHPMIFAPIVKGVIFSRDLDLAKKELSPEEGLKGMYQRLPSWITRHLRITKDNAQEFGLSNGSTFKAFSYTQGEGGTYTHIIFDETDRYAIPGRDKVLFNNVKPAMEKAKSVAMGSISDKTRPNSLIKNIYRAAKEGKNEWYPIFIPWHSRPDRDKEWYKKELASAIAREKDEARGKDWMAQQYPTTDDEAMAPTTQNKRIPYSHLQLVFKIKRPLRKHDGPAIPGLRVYRVPEAGKKYVLGADPAEGVPGGDDSSCDVLDKDTGEQVATLRGKYEPKAVFPGFLFQIAQYFNDADIMVERNNHGHAVLGALDGLVASAPGCQIELLRYPHDNKEGWLSSTKGKTLLYDECASQIKEEDTTIYDGITKDQLSDIDINTLRAAQGDHEDAADSYALACVGRVVPTSHIDGKIFH